MPEWLATTITLSLMTFVGLYLTCAGRFRWMP
jgi:hypothetical protein